MLSAIVKKELSHQLVSYRFLIASALLGVLAGLTALAGTADFAQRHETYESQLAEHELELSQVPVYSYLQPVALRPPERLALFERGFEGRVGTEVRIHVFEIPTVTDAVRRNPFMASFRNLDLTTIVEVFLGLQALLLTFDAVVGEKEQKNLQLVLAHSVGRATVLAGKFLGAFLALLVPLLLSVVLSLAIVFERGAIGLDRQDGLRLAGIFGASAAYLAVMLLLGLFISLKSKSAPRALVSAVLAWLVLVFLLPQTVSAVAAVAMRGSAAVENAVAGLEEEKAHLSGQAWERDPLRTLPSGDYAPVLFQAENGAVLRRCGSARYYDSLAHFYREETALGMDYARRIFALRRAQTGEVRKAERIAAAVMSVSPAFLLERIATSFANTSIAETDAFLAACRAYRTELVEFFRRKKAFSSWRWFTDDPVETRPWPTFLGLEPEDVDETNIRELINRFLDPAIQQKQRPELAAVGPARDLDLGGLPRFSFRGTSPLEAGLRVVPEILLLVGLGGVLAGAAWLTLRRYEAG